MRILAPLLSLLVLSRCVAQSPDFAENNAGQWSAFAPVDNAAASVENSTARVKDGVSAILFTTASGFDTGVRFPSTASLNFNASAYNYLTFWEYPENTTPFGWQEAQPVVVVRTGTGTITLTPQSPSMSNFAWRMTKVPLAGGSGWTRTTTGTPNLADVDQIEIHHDTWDYGFRIWIDGLRFRQLDANSLPPAGPVPPVGVDPDAIESKVLLYVFDPIMENFGGQRMHEVYGWENPLTLTTQIQADLFASSHGRARYHLVETVLADEYPRFQDGFQHTDSTFAVDWAARNFHQSTFDYVAFSAAHNLAARVDAGEIDEVWIYAPPIAGMWESCMAGQGAYWINGVPYPDAGGQRVFPIMGWNFERGVGEAIHSFGHRCESVLADKVYGQWCHASRCNTWSRFALRNDQAPGLGGVGDVHFPVNGTADYDYANPSNIASNADAWLDYPNLSEQTRVFNFHEWSPAGLDPQREYLNWWYSHMPHMPSRAPDQYLANWWRYLLDLDQFKAGNANLSLTLGLPEVAVTSPVQGASIRGRVTLRASAQVDGALGRVDFYVDGQYKASDTLAPYTFDWLALDAPGSHILVARAFELQNGTEGVSIPVLVNVECLADLDDGGGTGVADNAVDINDLLFFLIRFEEGSAAADLDDGSGLGISDQAVDVNDLLCFLARFELGC